MSLSNDGTIFATGTSDKKVYAFESETGKELWSYQMDITGNAPPTLFKLNGSNYLLVLASGGFNFASPERGTILYKFKLD